MTDAEEPRARRFAECRGHFESCSVSLALYGVELDPDVVTQRLGREPSLARRRGDRASPRATPASFGCWLFEIEAAPPKTPSEIAGELLDHFSEDPGLWATLRGDYSLQIRFGFHASTLTGCFELEPDVANRLAATGATLAFHFYSHGD